jgi:hypothetical protein
VHNDNNDLVEVVVTQLPKCQFCSQEAQYDGSTKMGPWAYMCAYHFKYLGRGRLGLGVAQRLVLKAKS